MLNPWLGIGLVLAVLLGLMAVLRRVGRTLHPEVTRKLLHVGMGLVTLAFPWIFAAAWPAWVLAGVSVLLLGAAKLPALRKRLGGVVDGVERESLGDLYFPISVALIFQLAHQRPVLYCIPVLLLTLADAVAALIGIFYGHRHYDTVHGQKSAEGSAAFFAVAFLSTLAPLLLYTDVGRVEALLLAATVGLLVMLIEAVSWGGLDNLLVPLGGYFLLAGYLPMRATGLAVLLVATLAWVVFVLLLRRRSTLNEGALLGAALVGYLTWSLGGWIWLIAPLLLYLGYTVMWPRGELLRRHPHNVHAVAAVCAPGLLWLAIARRYGYDELLLPYTAFYAAQLAFIGIAYFREVHGRVATLPLAAWSAGRSWAVLFIPFVLLHGYAGQTLGRAGFAFLAVALGTVAFNLSVPPPERYSIEQFPWLRQALIGALASLLCLLPLYW